ncbi:c-type cytochrome [Rhodopila sp.]|uniref:c-type cytochrome n=1 Tax=Rhodopila sp. TaxID=2480087 RepID=UPI003D0A771F
MAVFSNSQVNRIVVVLAVVMWAAVRGSGAVRADSSTVTAAGVTLHSVSVDLPGSDRSFPNAAGAEAVNNNCTGCHSPGMVLTQPPLPASVWQTEVNKMRTTYKAPIVAEDVPAIVAYLTQIDGAK